MDCIECGYALQEFDKVCRRCGRAAGDQRPRDPDRILGRLDVGACAPGEEFYNRRAEVVVTPAGLFILDAAREGLAAGGSGARASAVLMGCGAALLTGLCGLCIGVAGQLAGPRPDGRYGSTLSMVLVLWCLAPILGYAGYAWAGARARRRQRATAPMPTAADLRAKAAAEGDSTFFIPMAAMLEQAYLSAVFLVLPEPWVKGQVSNLWASKDKRDKLRSLVRLATRNSAFEFRTEAPTEQPPPEA